MRAPSPRVVALGLQRLHLELDRVALLAHVVADGRIEVRLPAVGPEAAWHRLAAEQRASALLDRAVTAVDLRNPEWLSVRLPDAATLAAAKAPGA